MHMYTIAHPVLMTIHSRIYSDIDGVPAPTTMGGHTVGQPAEENQWGSLCNLESLHPVPAPTLAPEKKRKSKLVRRGYIMHAQLHWYRWVNKFRSPQHPLRNGAKSVQELQLLLFFFFFYLRPREVPVTWLSLYGQLPFTYCYVSEASLGTRGRWNWLKNGKYKMHFIDCFLYLSGIFVLSLTENKAPCLWRLRPTELGRMQKRAPVLCSVTCYRWQHFDRVRRGLVMWL